MPRHSMLISALTLARDDAVSGRLLRHSFRRVRSVLSCRSRPSGFPDRIARLIAGEMSETHPQRVFVENKPGAGGMIGSTEVARAAPDGATLLMSTMPTLVLAPLINPRPDFRPVEDFSHIATSAVRPTPLSSRPRANCSPSPT